MPSDGQERQEMQHASGRQAGRNGRAGDTVDLEQAHRRTVKAGQEMYSSMHQADRWTEKAGQEIDHAAGQQTDIKGRAGD